MDNPNNNNDNNNNSSIYNHYNIGDKIYFIEYNKIKSATIKKIIISSKYLFEVEYEVSGTDKTVKHREAFLSSNNLVKYLLSNIVEYN